MIDHHDVLIVGAGHGGAQTAAALRQAGFAGSVALLGEERELPYERPPLSKDYLAGVKPWERMLIRPAAFWRDRAVTLLPGRHVVAIDPQARTAITADGAAIGYRRLVWATGGHARRLPCVGGDLAGVHTVRCRADVDRMIAELPTTRRVVVIGGGYVGLEAAAVLRTLGREVVLLEALPRVLARVAGEALSRFYEAEHRARGVDLRVGARVECIEGEGSGEGEGRGRVTGVRLADGEVIAADMVIAGIGIVPAAAALLAAGAAGGDGVEVDARCRTSLADIWAVGDVARHANRFSAGAMVRVESVQNAHDQATVAARDIAGHEASYDAVPWFWSHQYDLKLQTVGLSTGHDAAIVRGDPATRAFSIVYLRDGRVIALDCVNATRDYVGGRRLVEQGVAADPARLADAAVALKEL